MPASTASSLASPLPYAGGITQVLGLQAGHFTDTRRPTGCSVVIAPHGAVGGVDVRGAAPGTRETDLLDPANLVGVVHAVLFDLHVGDAGIRPDAAAGEAACAAASNAPLAQGSVGAGAGATVGKLFGMPYAMKGGIGTASVTVNGVTMGALIAVNALGDVVDPATGTPIAGARTAGGDALRGSVAAVLAGEAPLSLLSGTNTTIGVVATDAPLTKAQCQRLAGAGHDGLARAIRPVHTMSDGDTLFALATGQSQPMDFNVLCVMAAEAVQAACVNAVRAATGVRVDGTWWPAAADLA